MIIGTTGRLGKGKTLSAVMMAYSEFLEHRKIFSNIWLKFEHTPIRSPYDFIELKNGFALLDELWSLADNRKSHSALNNLTTILCLRSRKMDFDVFYTQQFVQIDIRILYITDYWIQPDTEPQHPKTPVILKQKITDADGKTQPERRYPCFDYLNLYNTKQDPYTIQHLIDSAIISKAIAKIYKQEPELKTELEELEAKANNKITNKQMKQAFSV